jgi:hypothetical protein
VTLDSMRGMSSLSPGFHKSYLESGTTSIPKKLAQTMLTSYHTKLLGA